MQHLTAGDHEFQPPSQRSASLSFRDALRCTNYVLSALFSALLITHMGVAAAAPPCYPSLPNCATLSPTASLAWNVTGDGFITFAMTVEGMQWGWLGLGISEGGMEGADMAIIHLQGGDSKAEDRWSVQEMMPTLDEQQDVQLLHCEQSSGNTLAVFRRPVVTCDTQDTPVLYDAQQILVFAYGMSWGYHGSQNRGSYSLTLWPNATAVAEAAAAAAAVAGPSGPQLLNFTMSMNNYLIPVDPTTYTCVNFALPSDVKHHIYYYDPVVTSSLVHHMVGYACRGEPTNVPLGSTYDCIHDMPGDCSLFYFLWAPGQGRVMMPPPAGLPFGLGSFQYLTLQIHYTNLPATPGQVDNSGFVLSYSPVLKQYDMGMLALGSMDINVPPGQASYTITPNVCPASCTSQFPQPVTLVQNFLHMHQIGSKIITQHIRGGVELDPLGHREYYDFDLQSMSSVPTDTRQLLPGDTLITTCTYDSTARSVNTTFGPASYDEMCYNFLAYYPAVDFVDTCTSIARLGMAACTTGQLLGSNLTLEQKVQAGYFVQPGNLSYTPYQPNCKASGTTSAPSPDKKHHRSAGGTAAITIILIILAVAAAVAITAGVRRHLRLHSLGKTYAPPGDQTLGMSHGGNFGGNFGGVGEKMGAGGYVAPASDSAVHGRVVPGAMYDGKAGFTPADAGAFMEAGMGRVEAGRSQEKHGLLR